MTEFSFLAKLTLYFLSGNHMRPLREKKMSCTLLYHYTGEKLVDSHVYL